VLEKITADGTSAATGRKVAPGNIPMLDKVLSSGFELLEGSVSPLIETSDGAFMIVSAREVFKAEPKPLADIRAEVVKSWKAEQKNDLLDKKAAEVMDRINLGESFEKIASAVGKNIERSKMLNRNSPASEAALGKGMVPALFSLDKIGQTTTVRGENSLSFVRLLDRKIDMPEKAPEAEVKRMQLMLTQSLQGDLLEQYRRGLMEKYNVSINADAIEEVYAPTESLE
jgi:peptidyl-prolyl cis-trans isomerase D